jgi:CHAT domain-containing protein
LEYSLGDERSYVWAVTPESIQSFELPKRSEIEAKARRVYELFTLKADALYPEALEDLAVTLLGPMADQLGQKRLLIVAEGALEFVPFSALPVPSKKSDALTGKTNRKYEPLISEHEIISAPSASVVAMLRKQFPLSRTTSQKLVVFADPVFEKEDQRVLSTKSQHQSGLKNRDKNAALPSDLGKAVSDLGLARFDRLRVSRREAELITSFAPNGRSLKALDFNASRAMATSPELGQYQIVHFATHSLLNNQHPELSGIVLSLVDEHGQLQDGFLRLYEIYNLKLDADLVVLSACQTALGKQVKGEGLVGLTRGFMYAGSPRVVASLWKVSDSATAELMKRFYQNMLEKKMRPSAALRVAQMSLSKEKQWAAPYYWAGFVIQGEWR